MFVQFEGFEWGVIQFVEFFREDSLGYQVLYCITYWIIMGNLQIRPVSDGSIV